MPRQAWVCNKCLAAYNDEGGASACERSHTVADIEIAHVKFEPFKPIPLAVIIKMTIGTAPYSSSKMIEYTRKDP